MPLHNLIDLTGQKFGRLTALEKISCKQGSTFWLCLCDCGTHSRVRSYQLRNGTIRSCGCLRREVWRGIRARQLKGVAA